jgi:hypothetical protein
MLRLFFQLKMMESLQFIATMYDELMASVGTSTANITSAPPIRQEIEAKISSVKAGILANDDIDLLPNLKSTLEQSAPASRIPIPKSDLEVIGGRAAHKLEQIKLGVAAKDITTELSPEEEAKLSQTVVSPKEAPKPIAPAPSAPSLNTSTPPSANEVSYSAMVDYMDAAGVVYGAQVSLFTNDSLSIHNSTNTQHFEGVDPIAIPYKLNDDISCEIRYTTSTGEEKTFSNMKFGLSSTGPSKNDDEHTEDYMFILAPNVIAVNNHSPNATGICEELRDATSVKIFFVNSNANTATDPYAGSNYPSVNVIDMYKISTGATWDPVQPAVGNTDIGSLQLSSARIEYTQHVNNDGEMIVYGIEPTGNEIEMNTYYYKASERQWYAPFLNTYDLTYLTPALTFPIDVIFRDPNYEEASSGSIQFTPENFGQQSYAGTGETAQVLYTVGSPTANTVSHDMHDMELMIAYQYGGQGSNTVTLPLMNPLAALAPQAANTIATFSTDGLVKVNDATPVEYDVQWQAEGLEIKVEQADDGSVKVTYHSAGSPTAAMFSGPALGTFIHEGYQWYVDPATYKSYEFISSDMEMDLYQLTYLPDGELDMNGEASVNFSYQIPRDGFTSMPLAEFNTGNFWFNGEKHNGTEPLNTPLTKKESFATFLGVPDFWKELYNSDYPRYSDQANITYNYKPHNPLRSSATGQNLTVIAQEYGDGYMTIQFKGPGETILTEFLYNPSDAKVRAQPTATGGNYKLYQMLADDSLVNVQFKAYDWQGNDMIAAGGNGAAFWVEECENVRTLYPEHIAGVENRLGGMMDNFTQFAPFNNFTNNVPLIQIMAGKFHVEVNNKVANIIRPLNGNPIAYVDHVDNQNPKISNHLLVEFGDSGRYLNFYAVHNSAMSSGGMPMIINDPTAKELLTQFEIAWPSNLEDLPSTPMKFRSTPQTKPLNLSYETLSRNGIQRISFVSSVHETDKLVLGIHDVTPWGFTEIKGSTQDPTSGKWYNSFDNDSELIWNALVYDNTFAYETNHHFGNPLPMTVRVELPPQAFGYADNF